MPAKNNAAHFLFITRLPKSKEVIAKTARLSNKRAFVLECWLNSRNIITSPALIPKRIKKDAKNLLMFM